MAGPFSTLGDRMSHGGTVVEASTVSGSVGKGIARVVLHAVAGRGAALLRIGNLDPYRRAAARVAPGTEI